MTMNPIAGRTAVAIALFMSVPHFDARFQIKERTARGGTSEVFRAHDRILAREVALKILGDDAADSDYVRREIDLLARMAHPGIVAYFDDGVTDEGRPYVVTEWLEGETLHARLARKALTLHESLKVVAGIAAALAYAHARGVVHRDVKPSNVVLLHGDPRVPKLIDFGIAHPEYVALSTRGGGLVGTPGYLAPEQARGEAVDARADVFSLGAVLYECLAGVPAFGRGSSVTVLARLLLDDAPRLAESRPDAGEALAALVASMMARDVDARPRDARVVVQKLASIAAAIGSIAETAPRAHPGPGQREEIYCVLVAGSPGAKNAVDDAPPSALGARTIDDQRTTDRTEAADDRARTTSVPSSRALAVTAEAFGFRAVASPRSPLLALKRVGADAARAAREAVLCARAIAAQDPALAVAVAIGPGDVSSAPREGDVLGRALDLLRQSEAGARCDDATAALVDPTLPLERKGAGWAILPETASSTSPASAGEH